MLLYFKISSCLLLGLACASSITLDPKLEPIAELPSPLDECSGMISLGNDLYVGNNDSGNPAELCVFSLENSHAAKMVKILGVASEDWEELATDEEFVYIGDTGNNDGDRIDLAIYKVRKEDLKNRTEASAEKISFSYPEQKEFKSAKKHNFDCEAMVSIGDSLYLFTKNRGNSRTDMYSLPKTPGVYNARHLDSFDAGGLVTGADFKQTDTGTELVLVGYNTEDKGYHPFLIYFYEAQGLDFFKAPFKKLTFTGSLQTESVLFVGDHNVYVTNEEEHGDKGFVYQVDIQK
jgi:hypothetical protein